MKLYAPLLLLTVTMVLLVTPGASHGIASITSGQFIPAAPQGFGDRQNSFPWSMQWWRGHLYVGTNRAYRCTESVAFHNAFPDYFPYPPADSDVDCTADPADLPLQAEIWRWTPETESWTRVYQSPNDVPIPGRPGKFVARDIGFRGMTVFTEPNGSDTLYVAGVSARYLGYNVPPPRILRSTDGLTFHSVPQEPGTVLGNLPYTGFRGPMSFNGRLYIMAGPIQGSGIVLEAENPAGGNNNFRQVSPSGALISALKAYQGFLYLGVRDVANGYSVIKTNAVGSLPYTYVPVVEPGAGVVGQPNIEVLSMQIFRSQLYVGGNGINLTAGHFPVPAELIRINPDDTWDVVVGEARDTQTGLKEPISGIEAGFGNPYNQHMWQMEVFDDELYVGTYDASTSLKDQDPAPNIADGMGFDLYRTPNGVDFEQLTTNGFNDKFNYGVRTLQATPYGMFVGTANVYYGLQIWRIRQTYTVYMPAVWNPASTIPVSLSRN